MSDINDDLRSKVNEYKKRIHQLESDESSQGDEKSADDFELADLKAKLSLAESELKDTWDETRGNQNSVNKKMQSSDEEPLDPE